MGFFHLNFLNARGILAQGIYYGSTIFRQFSDVKSGVRSQQPSILGRLVTVEPQRTGISRPKESQSYLPMKKFI